MHFNLKKKYSQFSYLILDILEKLPKDDARVSFIYSELKAMNKHLESFELR